MHLANTHILIYILHITPFAERNLFLVFQLRLSVQVRLLSNKIFIFIPFFPCLKLLAYQVPSFCPLDSEEYIKILPTCWKGYTRKALALKGLGLQFFALCSAAIAFYRDKECCRRYEAFANEFYDLDGQWDVVDSSESLKRCLKLRRRDSIRRRVILLRNGHYDLSNIKSITNTTLAALECSSDVTINCDQLFFDQTCFFERLYGQVGYPN